MFLPYLAPFAVVVQLLSYVQLLWLHAKLPCSILSPVICSNPCPLSRWCHPTISSSIIPFSSCLQSFPVSGSFPISQFFTSGGQYIGVSASASVLPMNIQGWFPLGLPGLSSLQSKEVSRVLFRTTVQKCWFFCSQPSLCSCVWKSLSHIWLFATPWTIPSTEFSRPGVGCFSSLAQQTFPTQESNPGFLHYRWFFTSWTTRETQEYWSG